jgi:hypothetical protein
VRYGNIFPNRRSQQAFLHHGRNQYSKLSREICRYYPADGLNREAQYVYLDVDPPPTLTEKLET